MAGECGVGSEEGEINFQREVDTCAKCKQDTRPVR